MNTTPKQLGKYELVERLGHGGMAEVWKALDTQLQRHVAIKVLRPDLRDDPNFANRFRREAQLIASLHHPNIVQIHDFQIFQPDVNDADSRSSIAYMVMNYVEGETLADYLRKTSSRGHIPSPEEVVNLFASISQAIDYAHRQGMIHRDIKPANILLDQRNTTHNPMGEPILTDFGVAKLLSATANNITGGQPGTPLYISPEQARGYPGDARSDLYSLGVILYEIVTGVTPFRGNTPLDVVSQHVHATPTAPSLINPRISPPLALVIMRSLAKDPATRFESASALTAALADAVKVPRPEILGLRPSSSSEEVDMPTPTAPFPQAQVDVQNAETISTPVLEPTIREQVNISQANLTPELPYAAPDPISTPAMTPDPPIQVLPPAPPPLYPPPKPLAQKKQNKLLMILVPLLIVILIGGAVGTHALLNRPTPVAASSIVGKAFYVSSGQTMDRTAEGITDHLQIALQDIPAPHPGKSYWVWLLPDSHPLTNKDQAGPLPIHPPLLLTNNLPVHNKQVNFTYEGDSHNNNLLSASSRILITEGDAHQTLSAPSSNRATWRYYGEIPQAQIPNDAFGFSALIHIRHLFYNETNINALGLPGGLDTWMLNNTEQVFEWAISARDYWNGAATTPTQLSQMWQQSIRILDYLDGTINIHVDLPTGTPVLVNHITGRIGLLTVDPQHQIPSDYNVNPPGYINHVQLHVGQVARATDISPEMRQRTERILDDITRAGTWLKQVHEDARQLFLAGHNLKQLKQNGIGELLDQMVTYATYAYIGKLDPITNSIQGGVIQAHYEDQQLATMTITSKLPPNL